MKVPDDIRKKFVRFLESYDAAVDKPTSITSDIRSVSGDALLPIDCTEHTIRIWINYIKNVIAHDDNRNKRDVENAMRIANSLYRELEKKQNN